MIYDPHAHDFPYALEAPGDLQIVPTRGGIAARVIVHQHNGCSGLTDNREEDLPGMHNGSCKGSLGDLHITNLSVAIGEENHIEGLSFHVTAQGTKMSEDFLWGTQWLSRAP